MPAEAAAALIPAGANVGTSGFTGNAGVVGEAATTYGVAGFSKAKSGVRAASSTSEGIYATSTSGLGGRFGGARAAINLIPRPGTGRPTTGAHGRGDLVVDSAEFGTRVANAVRGTRRAYHDPVRRHRQPVGVGSSAGARRTEISLHES